MCYELFQPATALVLWNESTKNRTISVNLSYSKADQNVKFHKVTTLLKNNSTCKQELFNSTWFVPIVLRGTMCTPHVRAERLATEKIIALKTVAEFLQET